MRISFAYDPSHIHDIREKKLFLVQWGFSYEDLHEIPIDELNEFIIRINEYNKSKNSLSQDSNNEPTWNTSGSVNRTAF